MLFELALIIIELSIVILYIGLIQRSDVSFGRKKVYIAVFIFVLFMTMLTSATFIYHIVQNKIPWY